MLTPLPQQLRYIPQKLLNDYYTLPSFHLHLIIKIIIIISKTQSQNNHPKENKKFAQQYILARELGTGAFSVVKLAVNKATGQNTAVKIISKKKLSDEDLAALMVEIDILKKLDHGHVIKLYETFEEGTDFYIVTELVQGGELFDRIVAKTNYTEKEARDLVKVFLETIMYIHDAGVVHRDLKPENLLLCSGKLGVGPSFFNVFCFIFEKRKRAN